MIVDITYKGSSGHVYDLQARGILQREANYHVWEWLPIVTNLQYGVRVSAFGREPAVYTAQLIFRGPLAERKAVIDALHEDFELDVRTLKPGRITWGDYYIDCYISASSTHPDDEHLWADNDISIYAPYPFWIRENSKTFLPQDQPAAQTFLDYEYDYEYDYYIGSPGVAVWDTGVPFASEFRLTFFGPVEWPRLLINGHVYEVYDTLEASEYIVIDSKANTVTKTNVAGRTENIFDRRNKASSVFEQIPGGPLSFGWTGAFGFDLTLYEERSEPRWME